ncbi:MAG TPA: Gfo/Idh/MocA family oxidoreductase [Bryobacteraceae bacterium]|nr:Gfo/Idh/MocA family oxidoreductase [Bryobacteraceae bacterium]
MPDGLGRFLIVGCGSIGKRHLCNLQRLGVTDIVVFDEREDRRREAAERWNVATVDNIESGLEGSGIALICTPTHLHAGAALSAARAGCHLFIEKPLAHRLEDIDLLLEEITCRRLHTLVGCNFRFHPAMRELKRLMTEGIAGRPVSARAQFGQYLPDWHPWEDYRQGYSARREMGGGVVLDRVHELDYMRWLMGSVTEVCALTGRLSSLEIDSEDTAEILLYFQSGAIGSVHVDYVRRNPECRLEIIGEEGTLEWSYRNHSASWYVGRDRVRHHIEWPNYDPNDMYLDQMRHFLAVLEGRERAAHDVCDARNVLEIALAAKQSSAGRMFVALEPHA